jgi:hypothetical protein
MGSNVVNFSLALRGLYGQIIPKTFFGDVSNSISLSSSVRLKDDEE